MAENHVMAMKWIRQAQENGAMIIHVDPRFTRTSATADIFARIRPGADAAFLNTMINHILVHKLYDEDYVTTHTNALLLGRRGLRLQGWLFSGFDEENAQVPHRILGIPARRRRPAAGSREPGRSALHLHAPARILRALHAGRGERITGIPAAQIQQIAETMATNRPGTILYALGHDPAHDGGAGHPRVHHPAAAARQYRQARRRRECAARRAERPGRLRHGRAEQLHAGLSQLPGRIPSRRWTPGRRTTGRRGAST